MSAFETDAAVLMSWLGSAATEAGRGGGASGGGGSAGGRGSGFRIELRDSKPSPCSSWPSAALGTMSDRNSKSSVERASELRGLELPKELRLREKRPRNRDTADGGGCWGVCASASAAKSGASAYEDVDCVGDGVGAKATIDAREGSTGAGVCAGLGTELGCRSLSLDTDTERVWELSTLIRGDWVPASPEGMLDMEPREGEASFGVAMGTGVLDCLLDQKEKSPLEVLAIDGDSDSG